ncbi:hypothetical protein RRF57_003708 [Xylaria bambusicola]|uniref:Uncharacterized protein n=1 Tax=Xylaria bambusicola TaxID=326684 RepID=A0AAN7UHX2_9PEZI
MSPRRQRSSASDANLKEAHIGIRMVSRLHHDEIDTQFTCDNDALTRNPPPLPHVQRFITTCTKVGDGVSSI